MRLSEYLTEDGVSFGGIVYPKFNNIVILAGGSGSGKGFVIKNVLLINGKVFDIDDLKTLVIRNPDFDAAFFDYLEHGYKPKNRVLDNRVAEIIQKRLPPGKLDLKDPVNTSILHFFTAFKDYDNKLKHNMFFQAAKTDRKPNVIFDVTMKDTNILDMIHKYVILGGYSPENVHLVWVLNSVQKALDQNASRDRRVTDEIIRETHRGVSETMRRILKDYNTMMPSGMPVSELIQGDIWIVPNLEGVDSDVIKSLHGNSEILSFNRFKVKEQGEPPLPISVLNKKFTSRGSNVLGKINTYAPEEAKWI